MRRAGPVTAIVGARAIAAPGLIRGPEAVGHVGFGFSRPDANL